MGARYAVFVCKHHDGFLLWNSKHQNPNKKNYQVTNDVCGEVAEAFRSKGLKFGIYYSGGLDVTFNDTVIDDISKMYMAIPQSSIYADYVYAHYFELIDRYKPDILWNDIGLPVVVSAGKIFRYFKEKVPHGVVNDRWKRYRLMGLPLFKLLKNRMIYNKFNYYAAKHQFGKPHSDFLKLRFKKLF